MEPRDIGYLLNKATLLLRGELAKKLLEHDITVPQWAVLWDLYMQERLPVEDRHNTAAHVAERLMADRPTVSGIVDRLKNKDLIRTEPHPKDRRSSLLRLTENALALIPTLEDRSRQTLDQALSGLDEQQTEQLSAYLITVIRQMEDR